MVPAGLRLGKDPLAHPATIRIHRLKVDFSKDRRSIRPLQQPGTQATTSMAPEIRDTLVASKAVSNCSSPTARINRSTVGIPCMRLQLDRHQARARIVNVDAIY